MTKQLSAVPQELHGVLGLSVPATRGAYSLLDDSGVAMLADAVLTLLDKVGLIIQNREMLRALEEQGARVDYEAERATLPRRTVEEFVDSIHREYGGDAVPVPGPFVAPELPWTFHPLAVYLYDWGKGEKRIGNRDDFIYMTKLCTMLHPEHGVGHSLILSEAGAGVESLEAAMLLFEWARRPRGVYVQDVRQVPYLQEMEDIAGIQDPYWHWLANVSFATPLRLGRDIADRFVLMVKSGRYPAQVYNFAVSGVNMPVTTAGRAVVAAAEILALWLAARALNPAIPLTGALVDMASADMRTGEISYWAFDSVVGSLTTCELLRRWTGVTVSAGGGEYNPSKVPGAFVALEKAYRAMTVAAFTGCHPTVGIGHLEAGLSLCPVQLLLDRDISAALRFLEMPAVDQESIGLDAILAVGHGEHETYLTTEHTLRHFRQSLWMPEFLDRAGWDGIGGDQKVLQRAQARVDDLVASYSKPDFAPDKLAKMRQVVERARRAL
ncbi:MAG: trimethylamine methyltransferase family protein [Anaerolineae bacterium]